MGEVRCASDVRLTVAGDGSSSQAYHWATIYPDVVEKFVAICSSARTSPHNIWCVPFFFFLRVRCVRHFWGGAFRVAPVRSLRDAPGRADARASRGG